MADVDRDEVAKCSSSSMHHVDKSLVIDAGRTAKHNNSAQHFSVIPSRKEQYHLYQVAVHYM